MVSVEYDQTTNVQGVVADQIHRVSPERRVPSTVCGVVNGHDDMPITVDEGKVGSCGLTDEVDVSCCTHSNARLRLDAF